jgi:23S rRNA (uracil1939-C5)-methyltransferase/tRNA (uracil-5-)-methyltransferase
MSKNGVFYKMTTKGGDKVFEFKAGEFFQNNAFILPTLVEHVRALATGDGCRNLVDTYCGSGLFSICLSADFDHVVGVEVSDLAVESARRNAELNGVQHAHFLTAEAEEIFTSGGSSGSGLAYLNPDETVVVIDPPRKGCEPAFLAQLFAFRPRKLVYVSCDPATQARDARAIVEDGGYTATSCTPYDLFPQTRHIENVMSFIR